MHATSDRVSIPPVTSVLLAASASRVSLLDLPLLSHAEPLLRVMTREQHSPITTISLLESGADHVGTHLHLHSVPLACSHRGACFPSLHLLASHHDDQAWDRNH